MSEGLAWLDQLVRSDAQRRSRTGDPDEIQAYYDEAMKYLMAQSRATQRADNKVYGIGQGAGMGAGTPYKAPPHQYAAPDVRSRPVPTQQQAYRAMLNPYAPPSPGAPIDYGNRPGTPIDYSPRFPTARPQPRPRPQNSPNPYAVPKPGIPINYGR